MIPPMRRRKRRDGIKTRVESLPWDQPGGSLLTGQVVPGVKAARAWSGLWCGTREPVAPMGWPGQWSGFVLRPVAWSENPKQQICEGESSDAGHRGGPTRSSGEGPVMGPERRGRVVLVSLAANRLWVGGAG